jgi:hypothetical protein
LADNLDGSYQIGYLLPSPAANPTITLVVMGTPVKTCLVDSCGSSANQPVLHWVASVHAGAAIPHSPLSNAYSTGLSVGGDLEYRFNPLLSLETFVGHDRFVPQTGGGDVWFTHLSEYVKATFGTGDVRPFVDAGVGVYFSSNTTHFGGGAGAGLQYWFKPKLALEGSYNFHAVNTAGTATKYSTTLVGLRIAF